ncbi:MAG: ABC transporter substrate-binding protein [Bacillota bacterium]
MRNWLRRRTLPTLVIVLLFTCGLLIGCGQEAEEPGEPVAPSTDEEPEPADEGPHYGGTFVVSNYADITHLNPFLSTDGTSNIVNTVIHRGLVQYRGNNEIIPMMAESWETSEDGLTWTFHIREGVTWHDGVEFTAEDVKFTYNLIMDPENKSVRLGNFEPVERIEVVDSHTLKIVTKEPYASLLDKMGTQGLVAKHHIEEHGLEGYNNHPLGTGPFKFVEWRPEEKVVLERFEDYWEGRPYLDRVEYVSIPEPSVRLIALETGEAHFNWWATPEEEIPRLIDDERFNVLQSLATDFHFIGLNCMHPFFEDYRARQAIAYAIDKEAIVENFATYTGTIADGPYSEAYGEYYNPDVLTRIRYDPDRALEILADLGWEEGADGLLHNEQGEVFEFSTMVKQGDELRINILVLVQQWLRDIGIQMRVEELEWTVLLTKLTETRTDYDAVIVQFGASPDPDHHTIFHSEGGFWLCNYTNERVDELLEKGRSVLDPEERKVYYDEYAEITSRELPVIYTWHSLTTRVLSSRFEGMTAEPAGHMNVIHEVWDTQAGGQ